MTERVQPATVGIDLGTTHSLVAVLSGGKPRVLPNALGQALTTSAVALENGQVVVGLAARDRWSGSSPHTAFSFKRAMGTGTTFKLEDRRRPGETQTFTAVELSACVLKSLKADAEAALGRPVDEAVISVPAYFNQLQRQATRDAAALAGLSAERLINEPTAAALAYGLGSLDREQTVVVLDLGGGTFDVTVLEILEGVIEIQSSAGDVQLGGDDFTTALARAVAENARVSTVDFDSAEGRRLWTAVEIAKRRLSRGEPSRVEVAIGPAEHRAVEVTDKLAARAWTRLLERCAVPIRRALGDADLTRDDIEHVLLVGGASRTPAFVELVSELFGLEPSAELPADEVVALGAAVQAGLKAEDEALDEVILTDVAPFTLGVEVSQDMGGRRISGVFSPIIERGTVIPVSRVEQYYATGPGEVPVTLRIFQGEYATTGRNLLLGEMPIVAPGNGPEPVDVRFSYDLNGLLEVDATVISTSKTTSMVFEQIPGRLGPEELERSRQRLSGLKFHPRDALPNTAALDRAEGVHHELHGEARQRLGERIHRFRLVLETQDEATIEVERRALRELTDAFGSPHPA